MAVLKDLNVSKAKEVDDMTTKGQDEQSFAEKLMEIRRKAEEEATAIEAVRDAYGHGKGKEGGGDSVAASIVTGAMGQQKILFEALQNQIAEANKQLLAAQAEREKAQTELYNERITILKAEKEKLDETAEAAKGAGAPKSQMEVYKEVRKEIEGEIEELAKRAPKSEGPQGISEQTMITLKKLELDQGRILARIQADAQEKTQEFQIKLREMDEESRRRWAQYRDDREFREQGLAGAQDLFAAIGDGITREREGTKTAEPSAKEEELEAHISSFPCSQCDDKVPVEVGAKHAVCPGCGSEYNIMAKG